MCLAWAWLVDRFTHVLSKAYVCSRHVCACLQAFARELVREHMRSCVCKLYVLGGHVGVRARVCAFVCVHACVFVCDCSLRLSRPA